MINNIKQIKTIPNISRIVGAVTVQVSNVLILDKMIEYFLDDIGIIFIHIVLSILMYCLRKYYHQSYDN